MSDKEKKKVTFGEWKSKPNPKSMDPSRTPIIAEVANAKNPQSKPPQSRRRTDHISEKSIKTGVLKNEKARSLPHCKERKVATKSLVRNCSVKPQEDLCVIKPHELKKHIMQAKDNDKPKSSQVVGVTYSGPTKHTSLKTAQQIRKISELDLENAYKCVDGLKLCEENAKKKSGLAVLNVAPDRKMYTDLVSVDVADHQLGPRITDVRKHHTKLHRDKEPMMTDFQRPNPKQPNIWPNFSPITTPFDPLCMYEGKAVAQHVMKWQQKGKNVINQF